MALPQQDEVLIIDIPFIFASLRKNGKLIASVTLGVMLLLVAVAYLPFQKNYRSEATLLFNPSSLPNIITNIDITNQFLEGQRRRVDPFRNQEELLKSRQLAERVYKALKDEKIDVPVSRPEKLVESMLSVEHVRETDFIKVSARAPRPEMAQNIAQIYVNTYLDMMEEIIYTPLQKQEQLFISQVDEAEKSLKDLNARIERYQREQSITDIDSESQLKITQLETLDRGIKDAEASLSERNAEVAQILKQLNIKRKDMASVINAVAGGQDGVLAGLQNRLYEAVKDYDAKSLTYAPTNPSMKKLEEEINTLKKQIADQQILTVGHSMDPGSILIKDELRAEMVNRLVTRDAQAKALDNRLVTLRRQAAALKVELKDIPEQQLEYSRLKLQQKNQETVLTKLQEKLAEVKIQKSAVQKNMIEIDPPNLPKNPDTPFGPNLIVLATLATFLLSSVALVTKDMLSSQALIPEYIESALDIPVLSVVPWLQGSQWKQLRSRNALEMTATAVSADVLDAYQNMALNLRVQRDVSGRNALVAASIMKSTDTPFLLANLAYCLAQSGERVLIVDTNLRSPSLHEVFGHSLNYDKGLTELINTLSESLYKKECPDNAKVIALAEQSILASGIHPQLDYLNAGVALNNTFEFLNSKGLIRLAEALKDQYDWVLFDAPPFLKSPDAAVLLGYLDGLLLFAEQDAEESGLRQVMRRARQLNSVIVGVVLRENAGITGF